MTSPAGGDAPDFVHRFVPAERDGLPTLLLLHGTGGNEDDLLPLGARLLPGAARLSPRGQVLERGMPRFFRRLAEGVFDVEDLWRRARDLAAFVAQARDRHALAEPPVAVGFSNGANIAVALMLLHPGVLSGGLLLRPMVPLVPDPLPALDGLPVQIIAGRADPVVARAQVEALADLLGRAGAAVSLDWIEGGHALTKDDLEIGALFLRALAGGST